MGINVVNYRGISLPNLLHKQIKNIIRVEYVLGELQADYMLKIHH